MSLRPYQTKLVAEVEAAFAAGHRCVLLQLGTGGGKTHTAASIIATVDGPVIFAAHLDSLIGDTAARLRAAGIECGIIAPWATAEPQHRIQVCSLGTLHARGTRPPAKLVILDECFPAGTRVSGRAIETLRVGDLVESMNHAGSCIEWRKVTSVMVRPSEELVRVRLDGGQTIECTPEHPFFADGEYRPAKELKHGDTLLELRTEGATAPEDVLGRMHGGTREAWARGCRPGPGGTQSQARVGPDAGEEPYAAGECTRQGLEHPQGNWAPADFERRQWERPDEAAGDARGSSGVADGGGGGDPPSPRRRPSTPLQAGRGERGSEGSDRSGRREPLPTGAPGAGPAKGRILVERRVDRVEVLESPGPDGSGRVLVYNLSVAGNENYFANGVLVHNCHRSEAPTVKAILADYPEARILGLTATPQRGDGAPLGDTFGAMVSGPTVRELTAMGALVPSRLVVPVDDGGRGDVVAELSRLPATSRALIFAASIAEAKSTAARLGDGVGQIYGDTPRGERERLRGELRAGKLRALIGVGVFVEGFDEPSVDVVALDATFGTLSRYLQAIGRGLRPFPGKTRCTVLDLRGAVFLHLPPDVDHEWSLTGEPTVKRVAGLSFSRCGDCWAVFERAPQCPRCGATRDVRALPIKRISDASRMEAIARMDPAVARQRYHAKLVHIGITRRRMSPVRAKAWADSEIARRGI